MNTGAAVRGAASGQRGVGWLRGGREGPGLTEGAAPSGPAPPQFPGLHRCVDLLPGQKRRLDKGEERGPRIRPGLPRPWGPDP